LPTTKAEQGVKKPTLGANRSEFGIEDGFHINGDEYLTAYD
jgi:hypothetical protein